MNLRGRVQLFLHRWHTPRTMRPGWLYERRTGLFRVEPFAAGRWRIVNAKGRHLGNIGELRRATDMVAEMNKPLIVGPVSEITNVAINGEPVDPESMSLIPFLWQKKIEKMNALCEARKIQTIDTIQ